MDRPLSDDQMRQLIPQATVIKYSELSDVLKTERRLPLPLVILYEVAPNQGHWVLVHRTPEGIEHFDSYGYKPDQEFSFIPSSFRKRSGQQRRLLVQTLLSLQSTGEKINYNQYKLQKDSPKISTCGRWVVLRYKFRDYSIKVFHDTVTRISKRLGITPDQLVTRVITS